MHRIVGVRLRLTPTYALFLSWAGNPRQRTSAPTDTQM